MGEISQQYLTDFAEVLLIFLKYVVSLTMIILDILLHVQLILELLSVHLFILNFQNLVKTKKYSTKLLTNIMFKLEEFMVSILKLMMVHMIFQIRGDSVDQRKNWYRI